MKKIILSAAILLMMGAGAFANTNDEVNQQTAQAFHKEFAAARNVSWEQKKDYIKATFLLNDQVLFAYYSYTGELQAVVRNIVSDKLPINLLTTLKNDYSGYWISDLFEVSADEQTTYYVTLENADTKINLRSNGDSWEVYSTIRK